MFARSNPLTRLPEGARRRQLRSVRLPVRVERSRDLAELAALCCALFLETWGGQRVFAARSPSHDVSADSVSLFATLIPQLERLRSDVAGVRSDVAGVRNDVKAVQATLGRVKKEVSDDPRKELANIGVTWSGDAFLEAVRTGDLRVVNLFVAGEIPMTSAVSQGRTLPVMLALNVTNPGPVLDVLVRGGLDVNDTYEVAGGIGRVKVSMLGRAIEKANVALVKALLGHHVDVNAAIQTFGVMGAPKDTFPLASAVSWRQMEIVFLLLDNDADPRVGDFAAYRETQSLAWRNRLNPGRSSHSSIGRARFESARARTQGQPGRVPSRTAAGSGCILLSRSVTASTPGHIVSGRSLRTDSPRSSAALNVAPSGCAHPSAGNCWGMTASQRAR
jgi:hypothetical protein